MLPRADTESVIAFVQVVAHKSFRGAAGKIGVPRSTLSERVRRLEERLGVRLLSRSTRAIRLTDAGERYYRQVVPALQSLQSAEDALAAESEQASGQLRLTAPIELGQVILPDILGTLRARYPALHIDAELSDRTVNLIEEGFDVAIRIGPLADSSLMGKKLGRLPALRTFASPGYLSAFGSPTKPEDLKAHACMAMSGGRDPKHWSFIVNGRQRRVPIEPQIMINSFSVLRELAINGSGIARLCGGDANDAVAQGSLVEVLANFSPKPVSCYAVYLGGKNQSPALRATVSVLKERFELALWERRLSFTVRMSD